MQLNLKKPIIFFDLETTGVDVTHDRIVEISMIKVLPSGEEIEKTRRVNPGIPIPADEFIICACACTRLCVCVCVCKPHP